MKIGFIGCGNMAGAMIRAFTKEAMSDAGDILISDASEDARNRAKAELGISTTANNLDVAAAADILFLAVKPQYYEAVLNEIKPALHESKLLVSIAPGKTLHWLSSQAGKTVPVLRTMPNTPAMVSAGITAVSPSEAVSKTMLDEACRLFSAFGRVEIVPESLMDTVVAVSGSSPAYIFVLIEAMADAAVHGGMPRKQAYTFAAQAVMGSAKMVLETGMHPGVLKDMVCSPGGTTIEAIRVLEETGFRSSVIEAMKACEEKAKGG